LPAVVNVNVTLGFAANDAGVPMTEAMNAQFVDVRAACP
jgi:glycerate kinase